MNTSKYSIFDNMIEGVQIIGYDWRYIYVNDSVTKHGKNSREDLIGHTMMEKYPGIENTEMFQAIQKCMITGECSQMINTFSFPDGSIGYFELRMQATEDGVLILSFDITDQKNAEHIIKEANVRLEDEVKLRTNELMHQKEIIEKQLQYLEEINSIKDKFFSIVAHDLKAPLNSLKSFSSLLIDRIDELSREDIVNMSKQLYTSVDNASRMAENLITWAKIQMQEFETRTEKIYLEDILLELYELYKDIAARKGVEIRYFIENNLTVLGDKNQITFIVRNLMNNAVKYTKRKGLVKLSANTITDDEVQISVSDNGIGFSETAKKKLFSMNKIRSENGTDGEKGTGLGLMLSYEFLKLNNGSIEFESKKGKGTTFNLRFKNGSDN